jgi:YebC/PmpR family DNA-binding regulatory protein
MQSAANLASSGGLGLDMPMNTSPTLGDNVMEMKSHDQDLKNRAAVFETRALHTVNSSSVGWVQLSSKHSRPKSVCYAERRPPLHNQRRRVGVVMMGRKFENNKVKMAKTAAANAKKSSYIGKKIQVSVKAGGPDPDANRALGLIMKEAQALNVKREIVDRNIKAASSDKGGADFKELTYELYGHGGVGFVINALSDNSNRSYTDVGTVAKKAALKLAESGSVLHNFEKKGRLAVNSALDEDELIELALENDVDDVAAAEPDPEGMRADGEDVKTVAWVQASDLGAMQKALVGAGHDCTANLVHEPMMLIECNEEDIEKNLRVLDRLEEVDDVDTVEHNMAL